MNSLSSKWLDGFEKAKCAPNPDYPLGKDIDASEGAALTCSISLPYPAKRIGCHVIQCAKCGMSVGVTTAGRPDDPRSVKIGCYGNKLRTVQ